MQKISFTTDDGVIIAANWFPAGKAEKCALLLHMRPATKESWNEFAAKLNEAGFSVLAIDLRGHGGSIIKNGKKIDYKDFLNGSHAECWQDIDAAIKWLQNQGTSDIAIIGGSIGANLAIDAMARYKEIKKGVTLSPGLEFLEITTDDKILKLENNQEIFLIASKDDEYSYQSAKKLSELNKNIKIKLYEDAGHAQIMFEKYPELMDEIIRW